VVDFASLRWLIVMEDHAYDVLHAPEIHLLNDAHRVTATCIPVTSARTDRKSLFERFAPITLPPGDYDIGKSSTTGCRWRRLVRRLVTLPQITVLRGVILTVDEGFAGRGPRIPSHSIALTLEMGVWAPSVPEPAT
jgi:hypothetical protein